MLSESPDRRDKTIAQFDEYYFKARPRFNAKAVQLLLLGNLDFRSASRYMSQFPQHERFKKSFINQKPLGILLLISDCD
jgi:hypothetical protein